jgi:hypothetical protein
MTNREKQHRLDQLAMHYLAALEAEDFEQLDQLWEQAEIDTDVAEMFHELTAELVAEQEGREKAGLETAILDKIEKHLPSAEVIRPQTGPLTAAEVAEYIRRHPPAGLTIDDLRLNEQLRASGEVVPTELGLSQVLKWGQRFGTAPEAYWRAFREVALDLWMQRSSGVENYQLAARPQRPQRPGGKA